MALEERRGPRKIFWDCGTPMDECSAAKVPHSGPKTKDYKAHSSYEDASDCAKQYAAKRTAEGDGIFLPNKPVIVKGGKAGRAMMPSIR